MSFYKVILFFTSLALLVLYFNITFYNTWLWGKALSPNNNMFDQMQNLDTSYRKQYRFGSSYMLYKDIARVLGTHDSAKGVVLLLPTTDYLRANNITDVDMPEPAVFYYFTGITSVWANSPDVQRANWTLLASKKMGMRVMDIKSKPQLDNLILMYKKYAK